MLYGSTQMRHGSTQMRHGSTRCCMQKVEGGTYIISFWIGFVRGALPTLTFRLVLLVVGVLDMEARASHRIVKSSQLLMVVSQVMVLGQSYTELLLPSF